MMKRLLLSLGIIAVTGGAAAFGTQALLSDTVDLTANTFSTGTVDLQISVGSGWAETQTGFTVANMMPGDTSSHYVWLQNNDSGAGLTIAAQATNLSGLLAASDVTITFTPVDSANATMGDAVTHTLTGWEANPYLLGIPDIASGTMQKYLMDVTISSGVTVADANTIFDFVFTGTQI